MTTPHGPDSPQHPDEPVPTDLPPSLLDRLAELEPEDDEDELFDYDDEDEQPDVTPAEPEVTSYDDGAFAAVGHVPAPVQLEKPVAAEAPEPAAVDPDEHDTTVLDPIEPTPTAEPAHASQETEVLALGVPEPTEHEPDSDPAAHAVPVGEAASPDEPAKRRRTRRRRISLPIVALLLMTVLMAAATAFLWLKVNEKDRAEDARRAGLEASRDAARLLFSYDYRTLDKDFSTGRALTTGEFRTQYEKTTTKVVADVAKQYKAVVKANVVSAGVVRATPSTVVTVVYVNQVTTSTRVTGEKVDLSRVRMTLERSGGRWRVTAVNAL